MSVVVVSLHERDVPLEVLEAVSIADRDLPKSLARLSDSPHLAEIAVLSTCMRTEVYALAERFHDGLADIVSYFEDLAGGATPGIRELLDVAYDDAAARHLFEVAAGVDSAVLGEGEILRQVRHAADVARRERALGPVLDGLFRHALEVGKRARTETAIARGITSFSHLAVQLAKNDLGGSLAGRRALVIGAGEMGAGVLDALGAQSPSPDITVANRNRSKLTAMSELPIRVIGLAQIPGELEHFDVVFSATASDSVLLTRPMFEAALARREPREMLVIDVAVPRDVDPTVGDLPGVRLVDLDELRRYADEQMANRREEISSVEEIIDEEIERYRVAARGRTMSPLISALRNRAEELRLAETARVSSSLDRLDEESRELFDSLTRRVIAKLLHEPTVQLKNAAGTSRGERLSEALRTLFDL